MNNMSKSDIDRLNRAANQLADGLKRIALGGLRIKTRISAGETETENGGWYAEVARWRDRPGVGVTLDQYALAPKRSFWVGFWSPDSERIDRLYENMPAPARTLYVKDTQEQNGIHVLKQALPSSLFNCPIAEYYEGEGEE